MTERFIWCVVFVLACVIPLAPTPARADEANLLLRLEEQQKIINSQNQRIDRLEQVLEGVINARQSGGSTASSKSTDTTPKSGASAQAKPSSTSSSSSTKTSDPEKLRGEGDGKKCSDL